jgi:hypothetical protein
MRLAAALRPRGDAGPHPASRGFGERIEGDTSDALLNEPHRVDDVLEQDGDRALHRIGTASRRIVSLSIG